MPKRTLPKEATCKSDNKAAAKKRPSGRPRSGYKWSPRLGIYVPKLKTHARREKELEKKKAGPKQGNKIGAKFPRGRPRVGMVWIEATKQWMPDPAFTGKLPKSQMRARNRGRPRGRPPIGLSWNVALQRYTKDPMSI